MAFSYSATRIGGRSYLLYSCLINPDASSSCTKLISTKLFGSAVAAFGVRGVRLYQDGIPVTMPDGQGQTGSFSLLSAERVEILRGPFSAQYGNASGGVISVFTEEPREAPLFTVTGGGGSYGTGTFGVKMSGAGAHVGAVVAASEFVTEGFRDHSWARRDLTNAKLVFDPRALLPGVLWKMNELKRNVENLSDASR